MEKSDFPPVSVRFKATKPCKVWMKLNGKIFEYSAEEPPELQGSRLSQKWCISNHHYSFLLHPGEEKLKFERNDGDKLSITKVEEEHRAEVAHAKGGLGLTHH